MSTRFSKIIPLISWVAMTLWVIVLPLYAYKIYITEGNTDFEVYYRAALRLSQGKWADIYNLADGACPFRYAPITLLFFRPLAAFTYSVSQEIWYFLQYSWFILGFFLLHQVMKLIGARYPQAVTSLASLFILRFCLDCFTIGQVSSLLFLFSALSLYSWSRWQVGSAACAMLVPAIFKIGPGILFPLFLKWAPQGRWEVLVKPCLFLGLLSLGLGLSLTLEAGSLFHAGPSVVWSSLWSSWMMVVIQDSTYFDAAHYGSQSIKSFLLRLAASGQLTMLQASWSYLLVSCALCVSLFRFWLLYTPSGPKGRAYFFALGIFPYLWVMPETFKYTLTLLAIPVALLLVEVVEGRASRWTKFAIFFATLTLSLAGKDLIGEPLFFGLQKASIPLLATFFLGLATLEQTLGQVQRARRDQKSQGLGLPRRPEPWAPELSESFSKLNYSVIIPVPITEDSFFDISSIRLLTRFLQELEAGLIERQSGTFEICLEPYGHPVAFDQPVWLELARVAAENGWIFAQSKEVQGTWSLALRQSFLQSRGAKLLVLRAEQPCDPIFFHNALEVMTQTQGTAQPTSLVRGNRRLPKARFQIPVSSLWRVGRSHLLGLFVNRLIRLVVPIETTDSHSRILVIERKLAKEVFTLQGSSDFIFDLEMDLVARSQGMFQCDLPVTLYLTKEKTVAELLRDAAGVTSCLAVLIWRFHRGYYAPGPAMSSQFTADDWGISPEVNQGILELARKGIVRRVSVMARSRFVASGLAELQEIPGVKLGLHFDLTFEKARPRDVFFSWVLPRLPAKRRELERLLRLDFEAQIETLRLHQITPTYLDGHHHIHLVPGILSVLAKNIKSIGIDTVRIPYDPGHWLSRFLVLNVLALSVRVRLKKYGFNSLPCFYPKEADFLDLGRLRTRLARHAHSEVIVHPARANDFLEQGVQDSYSEGRVREYRALLLLQSSRESV